MSTKNVFKLNDVHDRVVAGTWITYNLSNDPGTLWLWGRNTVGQLGDNSLNPYSSPIQIPGTNWNQASATLQFSSATKADGTLWTWGFNDAGQLGINDMTHRSSPVQVPGTSWCCVEAGTAFTVAKKIDSTLWAWGCNSDRQLANYFSAIARSSPIQIPGTSWGKISVGVTNVWGLKSDGTLWGWGNNQSGQLGNSRVVCATNSYSPIQVPGTLWTDVSGHDSFVLATKSDGTLWSWGNNSNGRLGIDEGIQRCSPMQVPGNAWIDVFARTGKGFARKSDGTLWSWGYNCRGGLGDNTIIDRSSPVQIPGNSWSYLSGGDGNGFGIKTDGTLWGWGSGINGRVGDDTSINRSSPVQIPGTCWIKIGPGEQSFFARKSYTPPAPYDIIGTHLWSWGCGNDIGDNSFIGKCSPVQLLGYQWSAIGKGCVHTAAVKNDGTLWVWGLNYGGDESGILGLNNTISRCSPTQIPGTSWCDVTSHMRGSHVIKTDGTLWGWGQNCQVGGSFGTGAAGVVGDNTTINKSSPVQIPGTSWCKVRAGTRHVMGLKTDGTLWGWGNNYVGSLGVGNKVHRSSPTQIPGNNWCDVSVTYITTHALKTDGSLWAWGGGNYGALGVANNTGPFCSPVQIPGSWSKIAMGGPSSRASLALKSDGTLWSWGLNNQGNVGDSSVIPRSSPVQIPGNSWCEADVGACSSFAVKTDNTLWAWGWNGNYGLFLGLNDLIHRSSPTQIPGTGWVKAFGGAKSSMAFKCYTG
jgi:alpha-tubulin suppressor-like RCC1 family protein